MKVLITTDAIPLHFEQNASILMGKNFSNIVSQRLVEAHGYGGRPSDSVERRYAEMLLIDEAVQNGLLMVTTTHKNMTY